MAGFTLQDLSEQQHSEVRVDRPFAGPDLQFDGGDVLQVAGTDLVAVETLPELPEQLGAAGQAARMGQEIPQRCPADRRPFELRQAGGDGVVQVVVAMTLVSEARS